MGISLQIHEVPGTLILDEFVVQGEIQAVGALDTNLNNETYNYATVSKAVATPWRADNPLEPLAYAEGYVNIDDIRLVFPDEEGQEQITLMPASAAVVLYVGAFIIRGELSTGADVQISGIMEASDKRFIPMINLSVFPMFPTRVALPDPIPVALVSRIGVYKYHAAD